MKRFFKSKSALIVIALHFTLIISLYLSLLVSSGIVTSTQAASNNLSGKWISLGMEGVNVGAIAVSPDFVSDHTLFINSSEGIFKSSNTGKTWKKLTNGLPSWHPFSNSSDASIAVSPNYAIDQTLFVNTPTSDVIYRSKNGGEDWELVDLTIEEGNGPQIAISPDYKNDHTVFIGGSGFLAKSTDNGSTWQMLDPLPDYSYWLISDFAFFPFYATHQTIFATISGGDNNSNNARILKSTDGGVTWNLSIPFDQPGSGSWAVAASPNFSSDHTVFVGTDAVDGIHNLIKSMDGGITWQSSNTGIPVTDIQDIVISSDGTIYAGAGGGGAFISYNFGNSWTHLNDFPNSNVCGNFYSLALSPQYATDGTIFAACMTGFDENVDGVWKHVLSRSPDRDFALLSPFNNGVTWTVSSGYFNNRNQSKSGCHIGIGPDHCRNQLFGLDIVPDQQNDRDILAPGNGKVIFRGKLEDEDCIGLRITLDNGLNLNVCHFISFNVSQGERIARGKVLGTRSTPHVHLSLDDRYRIGILCPGKERCYLPTPFDRKHTIEGLSLDPDPNGEMVTLPYPLCDQRKNISCQFKVEFQQYQSLKGTSSNIAIP